MEMDRKAESYNENYSNEAEIETVQCCKHKVDIAS